MVSMSDMCNLASFVPGIHANVWGKNRWPGEAAGRSGGHREPPRASSAIKLREVTASCGPVGAKRLAGEESPRTIGNP